MTAFPHIGTRRELFVDDLLIESHHGTRLQLRHPERREVAYVADAPWEDTVAGFDCTFRVGDEVWAYYRSAILDLANEDNTACFGLLISTDGGRSFTRPNLGLVEFQGSTKNNLLQVGGIPQVPPGFLDQNPACPPAERFKGLTARWQELYAQVSPDGLHWRSLLDGPVKMTGTFDTINTAFWDTVAGCYRSYTRYFEHMTAETTAADVLGERPTVVRAIQTSTSPDFRTWTPPEKLRYRDDAANTQLYTNAIQPCPGAEHLYVGFPNRYVQERTPNAAHGVPGVNDALFMASRDGVTWTRYLDAWVRPGLDPRNWTDRNNYPIWGIIETSETEWSLLISEHYRQTDAPCQWRRLALRPHGFVALHADYAGGECLTKPFIFGGRELRLNFATSAAGSVQVELLDEYAAPIAGYTRADMAPIYGDDLDIPVRWSGGDLSRFIGTSVRLRFILHDADVFAFRTV